ncbi:class B sortase [Lachnospiraceae bacterium ZAX-1]
MKNVYYIGRFQFDSYSEYRKGLEDVKKIKYISDEMDINEPGVALRLYTLTRKKEIKFQSVIGEDYLLYLSDLVADDYQDIAEHRIENYELPKGQSLRKFAGIVCIAGAIICFLVFVGLEYSDRQKMKQLASLQENNEVAKVAQYVADLVNKKNHAQEEIEEVPSVVVNDEFAAESEVAEEQVEPTKEIEQKPREILMDYIGNYAENKDFVGWISIADTSINYPVMQSLEQYDYYLTHDFYKNEDINGSIFLDTRNRFADRDMNLIIYGHNMKSGLMFGSLSKYADRDYWLAHKTIQFDTLYEKGTYDIVAVCLSTIAYQDEDTFRFYNFINPDSQENLDAYRNNINNMNIFGEAVDITANDQLLTITTCNYFDEDGRLFLVAKKR